jgi:hypothetical protein
VVAGGVLLTLATQGWRELLGARAAPVAEPLPRPGAAGPTQTA